jgi:NAD(P)-dependent dehydrogenase (short-subunit alcohol dehydrogenase family)
MTQLVWFVTGSTRGFGRALVTAALHAGDAVAATARRPEQLSDLKAEFGDRIVPIAVDVTDAGAVRLALQAARDYFGRIDVVVNNAGYANMAPVEIADEQDFRTQFETNFWGVYNVSKAAIPLLRDGGGGTIIQFSSVGGRVGGSAGLGSYQAAKFAVDGLSRVLATETEAFGIRILVVEPSGFATDWAGSSMAVADVPPEYETSLGERLRFMRTSDLLRAGDPVRAAGVLIRIVRRQHLPTHLLLGAYAVTSALDYTRKQHAEAEEWAGVSRSADFIEPYPVEFPEDAAP